jgi:hypothetical protein
MSFHIMALYLCVFTFGVSPARQGGGLPNKTSMTVLYSMVFRLYRDGSRISIAQWVIPWDLLVPHSIFVRIYMTDEL